jgi:FAD/FMN-containing dehydrogenase/Fe-S oxidoreductase
MQVAAASDTERLAEALRRDLAGEVLFGRFDRGRYATDASHYQIVPLGVVVPKSREDVERALALAARHGVPVLPRGAGTSQCGQTVGEALVIDGSKHLNRLVALDAANRRCIVEPGMVLDELNRLLRPHGLWFPVDVSTSAQATIGGMTGNNSCGSRSLRYGTMRDNVEAVDAILADGAAMRFGPVPRDLHGVNDAAQRALVADLLALGAREAAEIDRRFPKLMRRVGGYNIDALAPNGAANNLGHLLVGSEGTLAFFDRVELRLSPIPRNKTLGVCHFPSFYKAMAATKAIVGLGPVAVELVDRTMIELSRGIPQFAATVGKFVRGTPEAILLVEFAEEDQAENLRRLAALVALMGDLGFGWPNGGVVEAVDAGFQKAIWEVRKQGLNIMMSMRSEGKPISFIEDCAVPLEHLADYTARLTEIFRRHGTEGTWYAHASVGCLHVRPILNLRLDKDVKAMRAIAEAAFAMVREYKGSHSGEHGDGLVRSEFHAPMFGARMVESFEAVKDRLDPDGRFNPGKIVRPPKMDDRTLFRFGPGYAVPEMATALDWSGFAGAGGGFQGAVEMCNNNGACRKHGDGVMCPSFRVTGDERHLTRGRANTLRLAISGQLGPGALASDEMADTMALCVACKACRRECPTGVDMARMKIEVMAARAKARGLTFGERLVAHLPRYAPWARRFAGLANRRNASPFLARLMERHAGFSARRSLPRWRRDAFAGHGASFGPSVGAAGGDEVVLLADTFNTYFEPENVTAALDVLAASGARIHVAGAADGGRPLCCGRTYLAVGRVEAARREARRMLAGLAPFVARGLPVLGLEPSCLFTLRDEYLALGLGEAAAHLAERAMPIEDYLARDDVAARLRPKLGPVAPAAHLHGHCHQKSFDAMAPAAKALALVPGLTVAPIESSCCGMAGAFGYGRDTFDVSMKMAELALLPAVRKAAAGDIVVADGTSCRHQIADGAGREAVHVVRVLAKSLSAKREGATP